MTQTSKQPIAAPVSAVASGIPAGSEALAIAELLHGRAKDAPRFILHITVNDRSLDIIASALAFFAPDAEILRFPAWDCMPYDRGSPLSSLMAQRLRVLSALAETPPPHGGRIVLTTVNAATQRLAPRDVMRGVVTHLAKGQQINPIELVARLLAQGYRRAGKAMEPGEFALRGGIIDIVPPGESEGVRIDFFGNDIESLRPFDPLTQVSQGSLKSVTLSPISEVLLTEETSQRFRENYRDLFGAVTKEDPLYEAISSLHAYPGMEHWLPLFYDHTETLFEYAEGALVTLDAATQAVLEEREETIADYYAARLDALKNISKKHSFAQGAIYHPLPPEKLFLLADSWQKTLSAFSTLRFSPFADESSQASLNFGFKPGMRFLPNQGTPFEQLKERARAASEQNKNLLLACFTTGSCERLQTLLLEHDFHPVRIERLSEMKNVRGQAIALAVLPLEHGFETPKTVILSEQDVLGERIVRARPRKKKSELFLQEAANFMEGELVAHKEHGIGRFEGLVTITVSGAAHDCLKLVYADDDKLFLPVENIDMVTRFGLEEEGVKLDKLGGVAWQSRKARMKERILMAAAELLKIAAERQVREGAVIEVQPGSYEEFSSRFPYAETEDQARAIDDVLADLHGGKPMDRLICGDVGFGKTEVAIRAAFAAVSDPLRKVQVAVIAPTTLLARQHFRNFSERFEGFPVVVRQLSRMVGVAKQKQTREELAEGKVDIVIGTHALLAKQVNFKNLGLLIVDEEQHFGVAQKEKLKAMRANIHVLTLSATPIPRTLQMALTGVRDLSLITTPPVDRLAVRSFVMPFDPVVLREAIERELHRGGRCFVVTPRIKDIGEVKAQITEIVPNARIAVAHGQLAPGALDEIMNDFYDGKFDILLSTAIIESGLDIPSANTMIIHNAHLFGLSQLYQLRGRVGRGKLRAYAYFILPPHRLLSPNATKRLEVMQTLDTLGAGFTLASHDMDIRGFGNLVGEEQSGHIREVGIELYQQMLEEAVEELRKANKQASADQPVPSATHDDWSPQINLGLSVLIPETYIEDLQLRLGLYRRAAGLASEDEINSFSAELVDRFGALPEEVEHLIVTLSIKALSKQAGIERIDTGPKGAVISFRHNVFSKADALIAYIDKHPRTLKIRPDQKLVFTHEWKDAAEKIAGVRKLAGEIAKLAD